MSHLTKTLQEFRERFGIYWTRIGGNVFGHCNEDDKMPVILGVEAIESFLKEKHLEYLKGEVERLKGGKWEYHHFSPSWAKDNNVSARLENELNEMMMNAHNSALSAEIALKESEIKEIK